METRVNINIIKIKKRSNNKKNTLLIHVLKMFELMNEHKIKRWLIETRWKNSIKYNKLMKIWIEETNYCLYFDINVKLILYYIKLLTKCNSVYSISCSYLL
jgi:hypothetical protein